MKKVIVCLFVIALISSCSELGKSENCESNESIGYPLTLTFRDQEATWKKNGQEQVVLVSIRLTMHADQKIYYVVYAEDPAKVLAGQRLAIHFMDEYGSDLFGEFSPGWNHTNTQAIHSETKYAQKGLLKWPVSPEMFEHILQVSVSIKAPR